MLERRPLRHASGYFVDDLASLIGDVVPAGLDVDDKIPGLDVDDNIGNCAQRTLARVAVAVLLGVRLGNFRGVPVRFPMDHVYLWLSV